MTRLHADEVDVDEVLVRALLVDRLPRWAADPWVGPPVWVHGVAAARRRLDAVLADDLP